MTKKCRLISGRGRPGSLPLINMGEVLRLGDCPSQGWHRRFLLVAVGALSGADWRRACRGGARRTGAGRLRLRPSVRSPALNHVAGAQLPARGSLPARGFSAWCKVQGPGKARIEREARAAGARHGVSGILQTGPVVKVARGPGLSHTAPEAAG